MDDKIHIFEKAGLGKAPFRFVGYEHRTYQACPGAPVQVGGSCEYCGQGICNFYNIESADGRRFHVGPDCVAKTGDAGLKKVVAEHVRRAREDKAARVRFRDRGTLAGMLCNEAIVERLAAAPHPRGFSGLTALDWARWMFARAGATGTAATIKGIRAIVSEVPGC